MPYDIKKLISLINNYSKTAFINTEIPVICDELIINILEKLNINRGDQIYEHFYKNLIDIKKLIFSRNNSNNENEEDWKIFIEFINNYYLFWLNNWFFLDKILKKMLTGSYLELLLLLIKDFKLTFRDILTNECVLSEETFLSHPDFFETDDLLLPDELRPFIKRHDTQAVSSKFKFDPNFFEIERIEHFYNCLKEDNHADLIIFMLKHGFLDFSVLIRQMFVVQAEKYKAHDNAKKYSYREKYNPVNISSFQDWLKKWKNTCGIIEKEDGSGFDISETVSEQQKAIQHLVSHGFSEEYTKKAFALYVLNKNADRIFGEKMVSLDNSRIPNSLLVDFLHILPKGTKEIFFDHILTDDEFCNAIDCLKLFPELKKIYIKQQYLSDIKKTKLSELFNGETNPKLTAIRYFPDEKNINDSQYFNDLNFLKTLKISIFPIFNNNPVIKLEKENEFFEYHQKLAEHEKLELNTPWTLLFKKSSVERLFNYLQKEPALSNIKEISGDISDMNGIGDSSDFKKFVNFLPSLGNLENLSLTYSDKCTDINEKEREIKSKIVPTVNFTWTKEEKIQYQKSQPLPNETLETALLCIEQELEERSAEISTHDDDNAQIYPNEKDIDFYESSVSEFKNKLINALTKNEIINALTENEALKTYIEHFFGTVIDSVLEERERYIKILQEKLEPSLFSIKLSFSTDDDLHLLCQKIDVLSGLLDVLCEELKQFIGKKPEELNEVSTVFLKKLTQLTNFSAENSPVIAINSTYRIQQVSASAQFEVENNLDFSIINQARNSVGMFFKKLVVHFFKTLPSIQVPWAVKKETEKSIEKTSENYRDCFFTHSGECIFQAVQSTVKKYSENDAEKNGALKKVC